MSVDNFYKIRRHPSGGFAAVMGFASDDEERPVDPDKHQAFPTISAALEWACAQDSEYGVSVHPELRASEWTSDE